MDESEISPNRRVFVSIAGQEIGEKVPFKLPSTSPLTIFCVLSTECQIYNFMYEMYQQLIKVGLFSSHL